MSDQHAPRLAVATVTSDAYCLGTCVALRSFLRTNGWFSGDVLIVHEDLSEQNRAMLRGVMPAARLRPISDALRHRLDRLIAAVPRLKPVRSRFLSLDVFVHAEYDAILFCDSDVVFLDTVQPLFEHAGGLLAAPDGAALRQQARDPASFAQVERSPDALLATFNAGLLRIAAPHLGDTTHAALLALLDPAEWQDPATIHTDQRVLNLHFRDEVALIDPSWNLLMANGLAKTMRSVNGATMVHFNGPRKPWHAIDAGGSGPPGPATIDALRRWYAAYADMLSHWHLTDVSARRG